MEASNSVGGSLLDLEEKKMEGGMGQSLRLVRRNSYWHLADRSQEVVTKVDHW